MANLILDRNKIKEWIKKNQLVDITFSEYDESGNYWVTNIFEDESGKTYSVSFLNGDPTERITDAGRIIRGEYELTEVKKVEKTITVTEWEVV